MLSALIGNGVAAVATPASSQLLGRWALRRYAPFAFSITQTAIPTGILLGGSLGPLLAQSVVSYQTTSDLKHTLEAQAPIAFTSANSPAQPDARPVWSCRCRPFC